MITENDIEQVEAGKFYWVRWHKNFDWEIAQCYEEESGRKMVKFINGTFGMVRYAYELDSTPIEMKSAIKSVCENCNPNGYQDGNVIRCQKCNKALALIEQTVSQNKTKN
jgi:hypothetical protein